MRCAGARERVPQLARNPVALGEDQRGRDPGLRAEPAVDGLGGAAPDGGAEAGRPWNRERGIGAGLLLNAGRAQVDGFRTVGAHRAEPEPLDGDRAGFGRSAVAGVDADIGRARGVVAAATAGVGQHAQRRRALPADRGEVAGDPCGRAVGSGRGALLRCPAVGGGPGQPRHEEEEHRQDARFGTAP